MDFLTWVPFLSRTLLQWVATCLSDWAVLHQNAYIALGSLAGQRSYIYPRFLDLSQITKYTLLLT